MRGNIISGGHRGSALLLKAILLATATGGVTLLPSQVQAQAADRQFDIPAQALGDALMAFGRQSGLQVTAEGPLVEGRKSSAVAGRMAATQALSQLLAGTGLTFRYVGDNAVRLERAPVAENGAIQLGPVRVEGEAGSSTPANGLYAAPGEEAVRRFRGYAATRSATGTKSDTPIIEAPQTVTVVGAEEIETLKAQNLQDALGYVAGFARSEGLDRTTDTVSIRGFEVSSNGTIYRDGMKYSANYFNGQQEPYGLERIEVMKGAASVLYGASSPAGIINMVSKRPTSAPLHELNLQAGSFNRKQVSGDFGGRLDGDGRLSYRFTFLRRDSDTFVDYVPDNRTYIAPAIEWKPSASTSLTLLGEYQNDHTNYVYGLPAEGTVLPNINGRVPRGTFTGEPSFNRVDNERYSFGYLFTHELSEGVTFRSNLRYLLSNNVYNSVTSYSSILPDQRSVDRGAQLRKDRSSSLVSDNSIEYKLYTGAVEQNIIVGIDYSRFRHQTERYNLTVGSIDLFAPIYGRLPFGDPIPQDFSSRTMAERVGIYAQDQIKIADRFVVLIGARYDRVRYNEWAYFTGQKTADNEKNDAFVPRLGLVYLAGGGFAPFVSYSESFEPVGGRDRTGTRFKPTKGTSYEAGLRYQPEGSQTLLTASVYRTVQKNVLVDDPANATSADFFQVQLGEVRAQGIELEARTKLGANANLIAVYSHTDAKTTKASPLYPEQEGFRSTGIPRNQASIWVDYDFGTVGVPGLRVGSGVRYVGGSTPNYYFGQFTIPSFTLVDALVSYGPGNWKLSVNVSNLLDRTYVGSCNYGCFYGEPRRVIGTLAYRW